MALNESGPKPSTFPGQVHPAPGGGILVSKMEDVINWARSNSLWPLVFGTSCCAIEMMSTASAKYDWSRFGFEVARATPRQADVIIIAGTIVNKMAPVLKRLYDQMADPKYVIAMGACATSGGPFFYNTYSVVKGADHVIPVDVYIAGCPPRPEALLHALISLQEKIRSGATREQMKLKLSELLPTAVPEVGTEWITLVVDVSAWKEFATQLRFNTDLAFDFLF